MKILSVIRKTMKISFIRKTNQPLVWLLRFLQRVFAPETCWEIAHCSIMRKFGFENAYNNGVSIDENGNPIPWYTYPAIEYLKEIDFSDSVIFEFGTGNSTFWWEKEAKKVEAVEHDKEWYNKFNGKWSESTVVHFREGSQAYSSSLNGLYDVIIIDGQWRDLCAEEAVKHIKDDGMIILDDSQRVQTMDEYKSAFNVLKSDSRFIQIDFYGFSPIVLYTKVTTVFVSRKRDIKYKGKLIPLFGVGNINE